jgi:hypothetical protein
MLQKGREVLWLVLIAGLPPFEGKPYQKCNSTIFGYRGDRWAGGKALYLKRKVDPKKDIGIAHRRLPLGSWVYVKHLRTRKRVRAQVIDRGPYGAMHNGKWLIKRRRSDPGKWRGCADLTPLAAKMIGHDGWDRVAIYREARK